MPGRATIDYKEAERRYVVEGTSLRQIAGEMGLKSWSSMAHVARREDWKGKRQAYLNSVARRSYENAAAGVADERKGVIDEAILAGRATIRQYLKDLAAGKVHINPRDAQVWAAFLMDAMTEGPADKSAEVPNVRNVTPPDTELLRRVVDVARQRVAPAGSLGSAPLVVPQDPRPN